MARLVWVATGVAWAFRSLLDFFSPHYYHAGNLLDYLAVWSLTAALLLSAPAVIYLSRLSALRSVRVVAFAAGAGAVLAGLTNAAEDAFHVLGTGDVFIAGTLVLLAGTLMCTAILLIFQRWRLAAAFGLWFIGMLISTALPGGGLLILIALVAVATKPTWFAATAGAPPGKRPTAGR